jgi:hypothetical protein
MSVATDKERKAAQKDEDREHLSAAVRRDPVVASMTPEERGRVIAAAITKAGLDWEPGEFLLSQSGDVKIKQEQDLADYQARPKPLDSLYHGV